MERFFHCKRGREARWMWPGDLGNGYFYAMTLRPGLVLSLVNYQLWAPLSVDLHEDLGCWEITYRIPDQGAPLCWWVDWEKKTVHDPDRGYISCWQSWHGRVICPAQAPVRYIAIYIHPEVMAEFTRSGEGQLPPELHLGTSDFQRTLTLTPLITLRLHEILGCPFHHGLRQAFLESKALEIIVLSLAQLQTNPKASASPFVLSPCDHGSLDDVRKALLDDLKAPPSLAALARQAGMNQNKLNRRFRREFGSSIVRYWRICRLERARDLLAAGTMNVTQVAFEMGYAQQSNFTKEFKKHFNASPSTFLP